MKANGEGLQPRGGRDEDQTEDASVANVRSPSAAASARGRQLLHRRRCRSFRNLGREGRNDLALRGASALVFDAFCRRTWRRYPGRRAGQAHRPGARPHILAPELVVARAGGRRPARCLSRAVIETLRWAKNAAQTRMGSQAGYGKVATDNLTIELFQHDTNRNQEPNLHFHAVVANVTQGNDRKWRASQ